MCEFLSALDRMQLSKIPSAGKTNSSDAAIYPSLNADLEWQNYICFFLRARVNIFIAKESTSFDYKAPIAIPSLSKTQTV